MAIIKPFRALRPQQQLAEKDRFRDLITLLNPKQCNKIAITMSNNLDKNFTIFYFLLSRQTLNLMLYKNEWDLLIKNIKY